MLVTETSSDNLSTLARLIDDGEIKPSVGKVYPWRSGPGLAETRRNTSKARLFFRSLLMDDHRIRQPDASSGFHASRITSHRQLQIVPA